MSAAELNEIRWCAICGGTAVLEKARAQAPDTFHTRWYRMRCSSCSRVGPTTRSEDEAVAFWNRLNGSITPSKTNDRRLPWYYVPPYTGGNHEVLNTDGELVACFEDRGDAEWVVQLANRKGA